MQSALQTRRHALRKQVGVKVPTKQEYLEEQKARGPHRRGSSKSWEEVLSENQLHLEEQKGAQEQRRAKTTATVREPGRAGPVSRALVSMEIAATASPDDRTMPSVWHSNN
jgi:hypothetical protein